MDVRFDHIALALPRMADATPFLVGVLGGSPAFGADSGVYRFGQWRFANRARLEVLEPIGRDGFLHRFLAARGPGLHHRSEEHTSELQSRQYLVCRLLLEKKKKK